MPKNVVVLSDGTGQEGGKGNNSNVYKLFNMLLDRTPDQVVFYDRGLGTGWRKLTGNVGGSGIAKNIRECYQFIFEQYRSGDNIFLFGFSRGAATVRSLSAFINLFGILPECRSELIKRAWRIYRIRNDSRRKRRAEAFIGSHHNHWCNVKFLGVWDTVVALGLPFKTADAFVNWIPFWKHRFHNFQMSESVKCGCHALAIDDERKTFHPKLWDGKHNESQIMEQVWFCGSHSDVGGGYAETGLSDVALEWMVSKAVRRGLLIYPEHKVVTKPGVNGMMHDPRKGIGRLWRRKVRSWDSSKYGTPVVHASVLERTRNRDNLPEPPYSPWILRQEYEVEPDGAE